MTYFWIPTKPYTLTDAVNRIAAATGSYRGAMASADANFNGHSVSMERREYRSGSKLPEGADYWTAHYIWSGANYVGRGTFAQCLADAISFVERDGRGSSLTVKTETDEQADICRVMRLVERTKESEAAHYATWRDDRFNEVGNARRTHTVDLLLASKTANEYRLASMTADADKVCWLTRDGEKVYFAVNSTRERCTSIRMYKGQWQQNRSGGLDFLREQYRELQADGWQ